MACVRPTNKLQATKAAKDAVFGFIRQYEGKHSLSAPEMIKYMVLNFYFLNEAFDPITKGASFELTDANTVARFDSTRDHNYDDESTSLVVFGQIPNLDLPEGIREYRWTIEITNFANMVTFGIVLGPRGDRNASVLEARGWSMMTPGVFGMFFMSTHRFQIRNCAKKGFMRDYFDVSCELSELEKGAIIQVVLDNEEDILHFIINKKTVASVQREKLSEVVQREHYLTIFTSTKCGCGTFRLVDFAIKHHD